MRHKIQLTRVLQLLAFVIVVALILSSYVSAGKGEPKTRAQTLVERTLQNHPEADEAGISVRLLRGYRTIASTDSSDIGEACEKEDLEPMRTGNPSLCGEGEWRI